MRINLKVIFGYAVKKKIVTFCYPTVTVGYYLLCVYQEILTMGNFAPLTEVTSRASYVTNCGVGVTCNLSEIINLLHLFSIQVTQFMNKRVIGNMQ